MLTILEVFLSLLLGGIFMVSAIPKLRHPKGFIFTVLEYRMLPLVLGRLYGWLLPPIELFLALLLLSGIAISLVSSVFALLLFSFIVAIGLNMARGRDLACGCFGTKKQRKIGGNLLLQDVLLLIGALILTSLENRWGALTSWSVFRFVNFTGPQSLFPTLICLGLTACGVGLSRIPTIRKEKIVI